MAGNPILFMMTGGKGHLKSPDNQYFYLAALQNPALEI
jgi:hypothetical protein